MGSSSGRSRRPCTSLGLAATIADAADAPKHNATYAGSSYCKWGSAAWVFPDVGWE